MVNDLLHRTTDFYVRDDYEGVMFRYDAQGDRYFRRFVDQDLEAEVPKDSKLLFDTLLTGYEIASDVYFLKAG